MLTLPAELTRLYETLLTQQGVASQHRHYYLKWPRYYWDFRHKYGRIRLLLQRPVAAWLAFQNPRSLGSWNYRQAGDGVRGPQ